MAENYNIEIQVEPGGSNDVGLSVQANPTATLTMATEVGGEVHEKNAEAWAVGKRGGVDVASTDVTYHNNAKYFAEQAVMIAGLTVTCSTLPAGSSATAVVTDVDGHKNIAFGIPEGEDGTSGYMHIKWAAHQPTADSDMSDVPNDYIGVYTGSSATAPTTYTSYTWFKVKGEDGAAGPGVASGGTSGQFLMKTNSTDYATSWVTPDSTPGTNPDNVIKSSAVKAVKDTADFTKGLVAEEYDSVAHGGYAVGDYCYKTSSGTTKLMRCTGAVAQGGSWDPTKWTEVSLGEDVTDLRDGLTSANQAIEQLDYKGATFDYDDIQTFTAGHEGIVNWLKAKVEPVQAGSGDSSPSNVRSISGWTGVTIGATKKNLWDEDYTNYTTTWMSNNIQYWRRILKVRPSTSYTLSSTIPKNNSNGANLFLSNDPTSATTTSSHGVWNGNPRTITSAQDGTLVITWRNESGGFITDYTAQLEYGDDATTYEPYSGHIYSVTFPTSVGTVYGGELTVNADGTGKLVVTHYQQVLTGSSSEPWELVTGTYNYFRMNWAAHFENWIMSDKFTDINIGATANNIGMYVVNNNQVRLRYEVNNNLTVNDLKTWLASNNVTVILKYLDAYKLSYDLSAPQIATLLGQNNLWCDTGDCSFQYSESVDQGDTTTAVTTGEKAIWNNALNRLTDILDMLAFREAGFTATETHQQDTVIVVGTELYRTTAAIPAGNAIIPGTNCTKTTIIDEIVRLTT